jgi:hypothetical protein
MPLRTHCSAAIYRATAGAVILTLSVTGLLLTYERS